MSNSESSGENPNNEGTVYSISTPSPRPGESGVSGEQRQGPAQLLERVEAPLGGVLPTVRDIAGANPRLLGGQLAATLIVESIEQGRADLYAARREISDKQAVIDQLKIQIADLRVAEAKISTTLTAARSSQTLKSTCIFLGTAIAGLGLDQIKTSNFIVGGVLAALGVTLLIYGWLAGRGLTE